MLDLTTLLMALINKVLTKNLSLKKYKQGVILLTRMVLQIFHISQALKLTLSVFNTCKDLYFFIMPLFNVLQSFNNKEPNSFHVDREIPII